MSMYKKYSDLPGDDKPKPNYSSRPQQPQQQQENYQDPQECARIISADQKRDIINSHKVTVVDVYGDWCGPCNAVANEYFELSKKYSQPGVCAIVKENVDDGFSPNVTGVPSFTFYYNGEESGQVNGANMEEVRSTLFELLARP